VHKNDNKTNNNNNKYSYQTLTEDVGINLTPTANTERNYAAEKNPIVKQPFNRHSSYEGEIYEVLQYFLFLGGKV
jgi:hypothetical protein